MERPSQEQLAEIAHRRDKPAPAAGRPFARSASAKPADPGPAEWYVGIDGEPVGPIDKVYLKEQIDEGRVSASSLVWREELTDWRPLNSFAELRELLSARQPAAAPSSVASAPVALTRAKSQPLETSKPRSPGPEVAAPASEEPSVPETSAEPSSPALVDETPPSTALPVGLAGLAPPPSVKPAVPADDKGDGAGAPSQPEAKAAEVTAPRAPSRPPAASEPEDDELAAAGIPADSRSRRGLSPMAFAFIAMATAFGAVSAWFLFGQDKGDERLAGGPDGGVVAPPADDGSDPAPGGTSTPDPDETAEPDTEEPNGDGDEETTSGKGSAARPASGEEKPQSGKSDEPEDDGGQGPPPCSPDDPFCNPSGVSGPSAGPDDDGGSGSGAGLSQSQAQSVVSRYKGSLMRRCRSMVTKGSAKVGATIVVGSSGSVKSVAVSGGNEVPGLAGCVRNRIKNWSFPPSGGSTTINVSFNFL